MPRFNQDRIARLVSEMRNSITRLELLRGLEKASFLNDADKLASAKYNFIVAIESAIDICSNIISENGYRVPEDYGDTFQILGEHGAFDEDFLSSLKAMAKFRNRLVHLYWEVDSEQLYGILQSRIYDLKIFLDKIAKFIQVNRL